MYMAATSLQVLRLVKVERICFAFFGRRMLHVYRSQISHNARRPRREMGLMDLKADSFFVGRVATKNVTPAKHVAKGAQSESRSQEVQQ
jgi:hypothetical protein